MKIDFQNLQLVSVESSYYRSLRDWRLSPFSQKREAHQMREYFNNRRTYMSLEEQREAERYLSIIHEFTHYPYKMIADMGQSFSPH